MLSSLQNMGNQVKKSVETWAVDISNGAPSPGALAISFGGLGLRTPNHLQLPTLQGAQCMGAPRPVLNLNQPIFPSKQSEHFGRTFHSPKNNQFMGQE